MKANNNGALVATSGPTPEISVFLKLNTNNSYGQSSIALLHEALMSHRNTCTSLFFDEIKAGSYENAYCYWRSVLELNDLIDQMLTETASVSIQNYYAQEFARNPGGYRNWFERLPQDKAERCEMFLKEVSPESQTNQEKPASPATE